jgi:hypothetical protein
MPYDIGAYERQIYVAVPTTFPSDENFDELDGVGNNLPINWTSTRSGAVGDWTITDIFPSGGLFAAHTDDPGGVSDRTLDTPVFNIEQWGRLTFRHAFQLESIFNDPSSAYDAAVLEIKIGDGAFEDIRAAGGHFVEGGYTSVLIPGCGPNPLQVGRAVWSGDNGTLAYQNVIVDLPGSANGKSVQMRWRVASDCSGTHPGYWLDDVHVDVNRQPPDLVFADGFETL